MVVALDVGGVSAPWGVYPSQVDVWVKDVLGSRVTRHAIFGWTAIRMYGGGSAPRSGRTSWTARSAHPGDPLPTWFQHQPTTS